MFKHNNNCLDHTIAFYNEKNPKIIEQNIVLIILAITYR